MKNIYFIALYLIFCYKEALSDVTILYSPPNIKFEPSSPLHASDLENILCASLGYTPKSSSWKGLTITSSFNYPSALWMFGINTGAMPFKMDGISYEMLDDVSFLEMFDSFTSLIKSRAQRPLHFQYFTTKELHLQKSTEPYAEMESSTNRSEVEDLMAVLPSVVDLVKADSTFQDAGQDIIYVEIDPEKSRLGVGDSSVVESTLAKLVTQIRSIYDDRVLILLNTHSDDVIRTRRAAIIMNENQKQQEDINLSPVYQEDFPVVFNIVLILSIILIVSVIAVSVSMAFMDPGRDSIIYRMTNPRMKKDQ